MQICDEFYYKNVPICFGYYNDVHPHQSFLLHFNTLILFKLDQIEE